MELGYKALQSQPELPWVSKQMVLLWGFCFPVGVIIAAVAIINL